MKLAALATALGVLALAQPAAAAPQGPPTLPGGTLDARFPSLDVYLNPPAVAKAPVGPACAAAQAYVDRINAGQFSAVADLFAEDGLLYHRPGHYHRGLAAIREFYEGFVAPHKPKIIGVDFVGGDHECFVTLASNTAFGDTYRFMLAAVDVFTTGRDGKVIRMISYSRVQEGALPQKNN